MDGQTESTQYTYNSLNQMLTSTTTNAIGTITENKTYQYNANGNQKTEDGDVINYYYSQGGVLYTEDGGGNGTSLNQ